MKIFENIQVPSLPEIALHIIKTDAFVITGPTAPLSNNEVPTSIKLTKNTQVLLAEESVGYNGIWAKIILSDKSEGYVLQEKIATKTSEDIYSPISFPRSITPNLFKDFLPDQFAQEINWRDEPTEVYFLDKKRGLYSVLIDTGLEAIQGNTQEEKNTFLRNLMSDKLLVGLQAILKERGKRFDEQYVQDLQRKFYKFGVAEAIDFSLRNCSTLRVLVSLPMKYAESLDIENNSIQTVQLPLTAGETATNSQQQNNTDIIILQEQDFSPRYVDIIFENYEQYNDFFDEISLSPGFGALNVADVIYSARQWEIEPTNLTLNLAVEASNIELLKEMIDILIISNIPYNLATEALGLKDANFGLLKDARFATRQLGAASTKVSRDEKTVGAAKAVTQKFGAILSDSVGLNWQGNLLIKVDRKDLKIAYMEYKTSKGTKIPLNIGVFKFLEDEIVKSKTSVNYLLQRHLSKVKYEYYVELKKKFGDRQNVPQEEILAAEQEIKNSAAFQKYATAFQNEQFAETISEIKPDIEVKDEFISNISILTYSGGSEDFFSGLGSMASNLVLVEGNLQKFILNYHYPKVTLFEARPLNITNCVQDNYSIVKNAITSQGPRELEKLKKFRLSEAEKQRSREGSEFFKSFENYPKNITNRNLRILLGVETPPKSTPFQTLNRYIIPALKEINVNAILAEVIKCSSANMDPAAFADLLNKYNKAKKLLEQAAFATLCNPFLTAGLKKLNGFQLPVIPTYNPNKNLADELTNVVVKIIQDVLILSVRKILTDSIKACVKDKNKEKNPGADQIADDLLNALDDEDTDENVDDVLDKSFGLIAQDDQTQPELSIIGDGSASPIRLESRAAAKDNFKNILDKLLCLLTTKEICDLLNGFEVEAEVYEIIKNVVRAKDPAIANSFATRDDIKRFFSTIGGSIDLRICEEVYNSPNPIPSNPLCDDGTLQNARKTILEQKKLPENAIDAILQDLKNQETKNVEDILKFLDTDEPFNIDNLPSVLCQKAPDGTIIPPAVNLTPPLESFKGLLNTLFKDTYDTFDKEALNWSRTTYSITSSTPAPKIMIFDESSGKFKRDNTVLNSLKDESKDKIKANDKVTNQKTILPSYLFNEYLKSNTFYTGSGASQNFYAFIDGRKQQVLDGDLISESLINKVKAENDRLKLFLSDLMAMLSAAAASSVAQATANASVSTAGTLSTIENTFSDIFKQLSLFDNFVRSTAGEIDASPYSKFNKNDETFLKKFGSNAEATSMLFEQTGATLYLKIMEFIDKKQSDLKNLIDKIDSLLLANSSSGYRQQNSVKTALTNELTKLITEYTNIKKYYKVVLNASQTYPQFKLDFKDNLRTTNLLSLSLHDAYNLTIKKNSDTTNFINIQNYQEYDNEIGKYVSQVLKINTSNPTKKDVFNAFFTSSITAEDYKKIEKEFITAIGNTIKEKSQFLKIITLETSSATRKTFEDADGDKQKIKIINDAILKPVTDYLTLVLPNSPTPLQKQCGIRPHYLEIDSLKDDAFAKKQKSLCTEQIVNEKVRNNLPVNTSELESLETNDTQNIILLQVYRLALRVYLDDIVLRGISVFGYFDPQFLRDDNLLIDYLSNAVESEIRGTDNTFYNLMTAFFLKQYNLQNADSPLEDNKQNRKKILKDAIKTELKGPVLAKLAKRIVDDTNKNLTINGPSTGVPPIELNFINNLTDIQKIMGSDSFPVQNNIINIKLNGTNYKLGNGNLENFDNSKIEYRLVFEYLFPLKRYITLFFITNILSTSTRKSILDAFKGTKSGVRKLAKIVQANGQPVTPDFNNPQDILNSENGEDFFWFILEALLTTPIKIAKGLFEGLDPNVALSSTIYKIGKAFEPDLSCFLVPGIGIPLGFWFFSPFMFNPLNLIYYGLGLWYEDGNSNEKNKSDNQKRKFIDDLLNNAALGTSADCETAKDHEDIIRFNQSGYYVNINIK